MVCEGVVGGSGVAGAVRVATARWLGVGREFNVARTR